jgi:hypothetical protein
MTVTVLDPIDDVDEKFLENMVTYGKSVTGIDNVIFISPAHGQRGLRIKVAIDPPLRTRARGGMISISIEDPSQVIGRKPDAKLLARVRSFVELNRDALLQYWHSATMHPTWVSAQPWIPLDSPAC